MRVNWSWLGAVLVTGACAVSDGGPPPGADYPGWYDGPYYPWFEPGADPYGGGVVVEGGWGHPWHHGWHGGWHGDWQGRAHGGWHGGRPGGWHGGGHAGGHPGNRGGTHAAPGGEHR